MSVRRWNPLEWFFLNSGYNSIVIEPSDKRSDGSTYIKAIRAKSSVLIRKAGSALFGQVGNLRPAIYHTLDALNHQDS